MAGAGQDALPTPRLPAAPAAGYGAVMREVLPGVWDWEAVHPKLGEPVHCHYLADSQTAIDPLLPESGMEFFRERGVAGVVLANRHHARDAARLAAAFGCPVLCSERGLHEFERHDLVVSGFAFGDEPAPGLVAYEVCPEWPDETALLVTGARALVFADAIVSGEGEVRFVEDAWLGEEAEQEKEHLRRGLRRLLDLDFDHVLSGHGPPYVGGAKAALREFVGT